MSDDRDRRQASKRGDGQPLAWIEDELEAIEAQWTLTSSVQIALDEESVFERQWAFAVVGRALHALEAAFADGGKRARVFRELRPFLLGGTGLPARSEIAARLGITEDHLHLELSRLRTRYRRCLRTEVARTVPTGVDPGEEMAYLCRVLLAAG